MEKLNITKVWVVVCALLVQLKLSISFCFDFSLVLAVMGLFWSVKHSFLKMRGGLRRAFLALWTLVRKQERKGLIEKTSIWPKFNCVWEFHKPPQVLHPLRLPLYCLSSSRPRDHRTCCSTISFYSDFYRNHEYSPSPLILSASIVSSLIFARYRKDISFLRIW